MNPALPARPSLEYHRKQAKALLKSVRDGDRTALERFIRHHPLAANPSRAETVEWKLADAQLVVARQHGFASWPRFRAHIEALQPVVYPEERAMSPAAWDALIDRAQAQGATAFDALCLATDRELAGIGKLTHLKRLNLWRC